MWYLISTINPDEKYTLLVGKEYLVGRKDCDIIISGDASVSRKHAVLEVTHSEANLTDPKKLSVLTVKDSSKYGIYINKVKVTDKESHMLKDGDEVVFGTKLTYMVVYEPFIISMSCLDNVKKKTVRKLVCTLGGHVVNEWQRDCSLLVMNSINVTIKVICAMVGLKHIVTPEYIEQFVRYLKGEVEEPNPESFLPNVSEAQIDPTEVSFKRNSKRSSVFNGMTFIFLSAKQYKKMNMAVELGGGMSMLMEENSGGDDGVLIQRGTVVMNCMVDTNTQSQTEQGWIQHVQKYLKKHKKHMIQDAELGYAVLFCSTEKHCNPDNDFLSQMMSRVPSQSLSQADILVANTEPTQINSLPPRKRHATNDPDTINETKMTAVSDKKKGDTLKATTDIKDEPLSQGQSAGSRSQSDKQKRSKKELPSPTLKAEKAKTSSEKSPSPVPQGHRATRSNSRSLSPIPQTSRKTRSKSRSPSPIPQTNRKTRSKSRSPSQVPVSDKQRGSRSRSPVPSSRKQAEPIRGKINTSDDDNSEFPFGRAIKQEIVTPTKSPTKAGRSRNKDIDTEIKLEMSRSEKTKNHSSDNPKILNTNESPRQKQSVFDSIQMASQQKDEHETKSRSNKVKVEIDEDSDDDRRKKKRKIFDDSDEDLVEVPKRKRKQEVEDDDDDDDEFFAPRKKRQTKQNGNDKKNENKTQKRVCDTKEDESSTIKKKFVNKSDNEDMFGIHGNKLNRKTAGNVMSDEDNTTNGERKPETVDVRKKNKRRNQGLSDEEQDEVENPRMETFQEEEEESTNRRAAVKHETSFGFLTTVNPIEDQVCKTEYEREIDLPANCVVTEFVSLVSRKKKTTIREADDRGVPSGYMKWKGKLVKNYKKFKKTGHAGSNELPRIIGGSDLEAHIGSERKEIDEWFRDALEAESQQSEADRRATELFEWEPSHGNKRKGR